MLFANVAAILTDAFPPITAAVRRASTRSLGSPASSSAWRPEELSGGRSSAAEVPDKVLAG